MSAYELNNFIFLAARIPQIISNYKVGKSLCCVVVTANCCRFWLQDNAVLQAKSTGQLSFATTAMGLAGCIARIFTSIQEGAGLSMVRGFVLGTVHLA